MEQNKESSQKKWRGVVKELVLFITTFIKVICITLISLLGSASLYDIIHGDGYIPDPIYIPVQFRERTIAQYNSSSHIRISSSPEECWEGLDAAFIILDKTAPHVSDWVRNQMKEGRVVFEKENTWTYARYNALTDTLVINYATMVQTDGVKASILAHEWRHSRQNWGKWIKSAIACTILGKRVDSILENDARLYESKILLAFYS